MYRTRGILGFCEVNERSHVDIIFSPHFSCAHRPASLRTTGTNSTLSSCIYRVTLSHFNTYRVKLLDAVTLHLLVGHVVEGELHRGLSLALDEDDSGVTDIGSDKLTDTLVL